MLAGLEKQCLHSSWWRHTFCQLTLVQKMSSPAQQHIAQSLLLCLGSLSCACDFSCQTWVGLPKVAQLLSKSFHPAIILLNSWVLLASDLDDLPISMLPDQLPTILHIWDLTFVVSCMRIRVFPSFEASEGKKKWTGAKRLQCFLHVLCTAQKSLCEISHQIRLWWMQGSPCETTYSRRSQPKQIWLHHAQVKPDPGALLCLEGYPAIAASPPHSTLCTHPFHFPSIIQVCFLSPSALGEEEWVRSAP